MTRQTLSQIYDKIEGLVIKLPGPVQGPIMKELRPIKELFLEQRTPRLLLVDSHPESVGILFEALLDRPCWTPDLEDRFLAQDQDWISFGNSQRGRLSLKTLSHTTSLQRIRTHKPDAIIFPLGAQADPTDKETQEALANVCRLVETFLEEEPPLATPPLLMALLAQGLDVESTQQRRKELRKIFLERPELARVYAGSLLLGGRPRLRADQSVDHGSLHTPFTEARQEGIELLANEMPREARLEFARIFGARQAQLNIAHTLNKSFSAVAFVLGTQPIPFADLPLLTTLQTGLVAGTIYISGQELDMKLGAQFLAAMGINFGAAVVMRETARGLAKFVPGWGHAISGGVAGAGTYAIGRAAAAHFIEQTTMKDAQRLFQSVRKKKMAELDQE